MKAVANLCVSMKVFLKNQVNWNTVCGAIYRICTGVTLGLLIIILRFCKSIRSCLLDVMYLQRSSVCVTRIRLGLIFNTGVLLASSRRLNFGGPVIALWLTVKSLYDVVRVNETY